MYIVTYKEIDPYTEEREIKHQFILSQEKVEDFVTFLVKNETNGFIGDIQIFEATPIPYKKDVTVRLDIDW